MLLQTTWPSPACRAASGRPRTLTTPAVGRPVARRGSSSSLFCSTWQVSAQPSPLSLVQSFRVYFHVALPALSYARKNQPFAFQLSLVLYVRIGVFHAQKGHIRGAYPAKGPKCPPCLVLYGIKELSSATPRTFSWPVCWEELFSLFSIYKMAGDHNVDETLIFRLSVWISWTLPLYQQDLKKTKDC